MAEDGFCGHWSAALTAPDWRRREPQTSVVGPPASLNVRGRPGSFGIMKQADWAEEIARKLLEIPLPRRWAHTEGVAAQARSLAPMLGGDADLLEAAAWLHDIGYSPDLVVTGFHPLDGARYLRDFDDASDMLGRLGAHHSCAVIEAAERGLADELSREFALPRRDLDDALIYCDITTGPPNPPLPLQPRLPNLPARHSVHHHLLRSV